MKKRLIIFAVLVVPVRVFCTTAAIDSSYSYDYTQPPEFQPSLNSEFSSLASGVTDVMVNPAGILRVPTLEVALGGSALVTNPIKSDENKVYVNDVSAVGIQDSPNSRAYARLTDDRSASTQEARPISINEDYSKGGGLNFFGATYRIADWLAVSISRKRPTEISFNYQALAPVLASAQADFRGTSVEAGGAGNSVGITSDGTAEVLIGGTVVSQSNGPVWSGFLQQGTSEVNWLNASANDSITDQNSIVISTAVKTGGINWGLNIMPETIDLNLDNDAYIMSDSGNSNLKVYIPNFDFSSTEEAIFWATQECTTPDGFRTIEVETLAGSQLASAKVAGQYSASFVRMDLGMQWDPTDYLSFGGVYENFNDATVKLEGVTYVYVQHMIDTSAHFPTLEGSTYFDPFLSSPTHEVDTENAIRNVLTMQPIELPRKLRFGFALKKPILIAVDWEQWQNEYQFSSDPAHPDTAHNISVKNISFLKLGLESRIATLPMIVRGSITGMFKPETSDPQTEANLDKLYSTTPLIPVDGNIYLGFGVYNGELGIGVGGGGLPLVQALMFDMSSLVKVFYSNIYYKWGDWQVSYLFTLDPVLTGFSSDISTTAGQDSKIDLMQTSTLSVGFKF